MGVCEVTAGETSAELLLKRVASEIGSNFVVLCVAVLLVGVALLLAVMVGRMIGDAVARHRATAAPAAARAARPDSAADDDVRYKGDARAELPPEPELPRVRAKLAEIKAIYASYNKAIADYAFGTKGRAPDDLIDERVLSRADDDYVYDRTPQPPKPFPGPPPARAPKDE